jgi:protein disulfide isomerase
VLFLIRQDSDAALEAVLTESAKLLRGRIVVCMTGVRTPIEKRFMELAGADESQLPVVTLIEAHSGSGPYHTSRKYRLDPKGMTKDSVVKFVTDYEQQTLKPWLRSEPVPSAEDMMDGGVGILVGSTFVETAQDASKDVLIDFYAPWCGHCRKFEPQYKELAKKLRHVKSLKIMKLDATRNEIEGMNIMGFPTIVLFRAGKSPKQQIQYQGSRQPDDIVRWLQDHCTNKFDAKPPPDAKAADEAVESGLLDPSEEDL